MPSSRSVALFILLTAGCSAGAVAGTSSPPPFDDAGARDASRSDGQRSPGDDDDDDDDEPVTGTDAGVDANLGDGAGSDSSSPDAASDAGPADTGTHDAGPADTGTHDAGPAPDTGTPDTGPADTGAPDTGPADTGAPDSGTVCTLDDGTWIPSLTSYDVIAKGKLWWIDEDGTLLASWALSDLTGMTQGPCAGQAGTCRIDAMTWREDLEEYHIVHGGTLYRMDDAYALKGTTPLSSFAGIVATNGPCASRPGASCTFEAGAWRADLEEYHLVVDGKIWAIKADGSLVGSMNLTSFPGVAAGPCAGQVGTCHIDALTHRPDTAELHVIAKGAIYVLDLSGNLKSTTPLTSLPGMAQGPCL